MLVQAVGVANQDFEQGLGQLETLVRESLENRN